jgi:hypothetical protein
MKMHHFALRLAIPVFLGIALLSGATGCEKPTTPRVDPVQLGLDIYLYQHPQEANPNENVYLGGHLLNSLGVAQRGVRVSFSALPDTGRDITPFANTNPDSATGFTTRVTFVGRSPGVYKITGQVLDGGDIVGRDTVSILVRDPTNG